MHAWMHVCMYVYNTYKDCMTELLGKNAAVCTFRRSRHGAMEPWWATWCLPAASCAPVGKRWNSQMDMVTSLISNYEPNPSKYFLHLGDVQSLLDPVGELSHLMCFPVRGEVPRCLASVEVWTHTVYGHGMEKLGRITFRDCHMGWQTVGISIVGMM